MPNHTSALLTIANNIERVSKIVGHTVAWGTLVMVLTTALVVVLRHVFHVGWIWLQEIAVYMHALVFLLGAAYTLSDNEHVRVDVFYRSMGVIRRRWVETIGTVLFLLPTMAFIVWTSWSYVMRSWLTQESSHETGGLIYPFPSLLKSTILLACLLLALQGLAMLIRIWRDDTTALDESAQRGPASAEPKKADVDKPAVVRPGSQRDGDRSTDAGVI